MARLAQATGIEAGTAREEAKQGQGREVPGSKPGWASEAHPGRQAAHDRGALPPKLAAEPKVGRWPQIQRWLAEKLAIAIDGGAVQAVHALALL